MIKITLLIALLLAISLLPQTQAFAAENHAAPSATLLLPVELYLQPEADVRTMAIRNVFKKNRSPLADYADTYVRAADTYNIDWKLLPSISGLESSFGVHYVKGSYNAYGWGSGYIYFNSWEDGIYTISKALREKYYNKGADDVWKIGPIYAESLTWSVRVNSFMEEFNKEYVRLSSLNLAFAR